MNTIQRMIENAIAPFADRLYGSIARAILTTAADDSKGIQVVQGQFTDDETIDDLERFQNYGFTSVPLEGSEMVTVFPGANRDNGIVVSIDNRDFRLKGLEAGEVALYTDEGDKLVFKRGGTLEIVTSSKIIVNSPLVEIGDSGLESILNGETFQAGFNAHTHTGNSGAPTSPPLVASPPTDLSTKVKAAK